MCKAKSIHLVRDRPLGKLTHLEVRKSLHNSLLVQPSSATQTTSTSPTMSAVHVVKAALLLLSGLAFITVIHPPRPAAEGKRPVYKGQLFELVVRHLARLACVSPSRLFVSSAWLTVAIH